MARKRWTTSLFLIATLLCIGAMPFFGQSAPPRAAAESEARFALVIGNGDYPNVPLRNPANDARDLAESLGRLGFSVSLVVDGDLAAMGRAIRDFGNSIKRPDAVALFYYSGHGVQYRGANYLIPARTDIQDPDDLPYAAVNAEQVYAKMESAGSGTNIVILDACRNNPFPGSERALERGLAVVGLVQPPQSLIVYATAPGKTAQDGEGRNGVFTSALLEHLFDPGLDAELMLRRVREEVVAATGGAQIPWANSSITGSGFSFAGGGSLFVTTDPAGAEIFVDGERRGVSPLALSELPRYVEIEVSARSGSRSVARRLTLREGGEQRLDLKLEVARGSLLVKSNERGVKALIDGAPAALAPSGLIEGIEVGQHDLELQGDSSSFKSRVEVKAGAASTVTAVLVPQASLTLSIPTGATCKIEGMGIAETTSRWNYGSLPAGDYRLSVSGGDFEPHSEQIRLARGQRLDFAPAMRYTTDYLAAKFRIEFERLAAIEARGAVGQADVDEVAAFSSKVRAEARPELADLVAKADGLRGRLEARRAASGAASAPTAASRGLGTLSLVSDPPGINVVVDDGETYKTPFSLELPPGAHSFEPRASLADRTYYLGETKQWITVAAGAAVEVPLRPKAASAKLAFKLVPDGYTVYVDDEEAGTTPLDPIDVKAGAIQVRFERAGQAPQIKNLYPDPDETMTAVWGITREQAIELQRRTVKLDGKSDSWEGITPLYETASGLSARFMGEEAYGIKRVFMCKDDKYLYWRVDFNEKNPFSSHPRGMIKGIALQLNPWMEDLQRDFNMTVQYNQDQNRNESYLGSWDNIAKEWTKIADGVISTKQGKDMFTARLELTWIEKHCSDKPAYFQLTLANVGQDWQWVRVTREIQGLGFIDIKK